jgi:CspA family cold shock protein
MATGTIKAVKPDRGFGFIEPAEPGNDIFFHCRDLPPQTPFDETLRERRVEYEVTDTEKGPRAVNLRLVEW